MSDANRESAADLVDIIANQTLDLMRSLRKYEKHMAIPEWSQEVRSNLKVDVEKNIIKTPLCRLSPNHPECKVEHI